MPDPKKSASSKSAPKYALDAGDLLGGILNETQNEAAEEERRLRAELSKRVDAQRHAREAENERKRREVESALAEERARQEAAEALRTRVQAVAEELDEETSSGALRAAQEPELSGPKHVDFATHIRQPQSYVHPAIAERRPTWLMAAMLATILLLVGGGVATAVLLMTGPSLDPNSYPKSTLNLEGVTNNGTVLVALNHVPEPEPDPALVTDPTAEQVEQVANTTGRGGRNGRGGRGGTNGQNGEQQTPTGGPLDISLEGGNIFDRGSE